LPELLSSLGKEIRDMPEILETGNSGHAGNSGHVLIFFQNR